MNSELEHLKYVLDYTSTLLRVVDGLDFFFVTVVLWSGPFYTSAL